jgi:class 3 adenylate cyclase
MKLQSEIFLWISCLFIAGAIASLVIVEVSINRSISELKPSLTQEILGLSSDYSKYLIKNINENLNKKPPQDFSGTVPLGNQNVDYSFSKEDLKNSPIAIYILHHQNQIDSFNDHISHTIDSLRWRLAITAASTGLVVLIIVLFVLRAISKRISKPITQLAIAMKEIEHGNYPKLPATLKKEHVIELESLVHSFTAMVRSLEDREKIRSILDKVVSNEIAEKILNGNLSLGGECKKISVLFVDIRNFTRTTEHMPADKVILFLNHFMSHMSKTIDAHGGVIDKFVGDEIMVLFGAPIASEDHALQAVQTACSMIQELDSINSQYKKDNFPPIQVGIGINSGEVVLGNMGTKNRLNYTALGSNVNLASRLCSAARENEILISEFTFKEPEIDKNFIVTSGELREYKGFSEKILTYAVQKTKKIENT